MKKHGMKWWVAVAWAWAATGMAAVPASFDANGGHFAVERWNEVSESFSYETPTVMTNAGEWEFEWYDDDLDKVFYDWLSYRYGGDFQRPVRQGYAFDGWYTKRTGGEFAEMNESDSRTVYAHWIRTNAVSLAASVGETNLTLITGGDAPWFGQTNDVYHATAAARSGPVGDNETSWLETTVTGPGLVEFTWGVSCEETEAWGSQTHYRDCVTFSVDGVVSARLAGWGDPNHEYSVWKEEGCCWFIEQGKHTLRWEYRKDGSGSAGKDCAWLEGVCWEQIPPFNKILDNDDLSFRLGGDFAENIIGEYEGVWWFDEYGRETHDGVDAATTGIHPYVDWFHWLNLGYTNWMETTVTGPGTVSFWWKAICVEEELYDDDGDVIGHLYPDSLDFLIDGTVKSRVDGKTCDVWRHESFPVPDGSHTLRWAERSDLWYEGTCSWVDQVVWTPAQQTLMFDANGGSCELETLTAAYDGVYMLLPTPAWSNHVFLGWYTARAGGSRVENGQLVTPAASRTLYAQWTAKQATTFVVNGKTAASTVRTNTMGGTYGAFPAVTRPGWALAGWFTAPDGGEKVEEGSTVTGGTERTLYARWTTKTQKVRFDPNGGTCKKTSCSAVGTYTSLASASWEGRKFLGWYDARTGGNRVKIGMAVTGDAERTLYAHWRQTVRFDGNGGTCKKASVACVVGETYASLASAGWEGRKFLGWYDARTGGNRVKIGMTVTEDAERTLYAHWGQTVRFDANGGTCRKTSLTAVVGETYTTLATASRTGHAFRGWYDAPEGGNRVRIGMTVTDDAERTLYARWKADAAAVSITGFGRASRADSAARNGREGGTGYALRFKGVPGAVYEVQRASSLDGEWSVLGRWKAGDDGETELGLPDPSGAPAEFYRLAVPGAD